VNDPAGVSIDSLCRPSSSPQAITAGCTGKDGAALADSSTACESCSGGFFLFRGGCYSTESNSGSEICTKAEGGKCTACNTKDNYIFKNPAASPTPGSECILCSDATGADGVMGVANCHTCTAPTGNTGAATCNTCQEGYYLDNADKTCKPCTGCATCETAASTCTSCPEGKYLKSDNTCVEKSGCTGNTYPDPETRTCKESGIADCTTCKYNATVSKPQCTACTSQKMIKTEVDGTTTCVDAAGCATDNQAGSHFLNQAKDKCLLCSDITTDASNAPNKGIAGCKTCTKAASGSNPTCSACLEGYLFNTNDKTCTTKCADNCATCSEATNPNKCSTCMAGFFLKGSAPSECIACGDTAQGGIDGCAECSGTTGSLKCTKCKPNYNPSGEETNLTCTKVCEDETACGGTAGSCGAIVISASGEMTYYCSLCGDPTTFPINGLCTTDKGDNTCKDGVCTQCAAGYFLYMGGCYNTQTTPGNLMCSKASTTAGVCETPNANSRYFTVPGAASTDQSVLACGNPLGTTVDGNAYVGVEGCKTCEAPAALSPAGMASAKCTACDEGKVLTSSGYGCVTCGIAGCSACRADNMCEAYGDGHRRQPQHGRHGRNIGG
ncbi:Variant-specific surface protein, partial [Giardia duodenalis]